MEPKCKILGNFKSKFNSNSHADNTHHWCEQD